MKNKEDLAESKKNQGACYRIQLEGALDPRMMDWFEGVEVESVQQYDESARTILFCTGMDQPQLRGVLNAIWDLNLTIVSVQQTRTPEPTA